MGGKGAIAQCIGKEKNQIRLLNFLCNFCQCFETRKLHKISEWVIGRLEGRSHYILIEQMEKRVGDFGLSYVTFVSFLMSRSYIRLWF
jgi:hypothetical protein